MPTYFSSPAYEHGQTDSLGVLVVNLGTPDDPSPRSVRRYLDQFLSDPRVVEKPRLLWWLILNGVILRIRPSRSAEAYSKIWSEKGSPLLLFSQQITEGIEESLRSRLHGNVHAALGMSYGNPSIGAALDKLHAASARRIVLLPLYPQYSGTTTASVFDAVTAELSRRRWVPEFRFINHYHDEPAFITALADSIREHWADKGRGDKLMFSFHGVPQQTLFDGDPYHCQCQKTARLVVEELGLADDDWIIAFQSRVGRDEWLRPYADETIAELGKSGLGTLDVICPGFAADCLETLEEIALQNHELFVESGGDKLRYIPALNAREQHVDFLARLVERHAAGWPETTAGRDEAITATERERSRERARAMGAER